VKLTLLCVGKLGASPESGLAKDWARRATQTGRASGFGPVEIVEIEPRKGGRAAEAEALIRRFGTGMIIACDERGQAMRSRAFADHLARLRDDGVQHLTLVIGGADGLDASVLDRASLVLAFGPQTWPHALARAMLAEQVYRAATLMAGLPYHRD
jgi:23S rRNA (pseudouridine1915-N3)-methyltransferase